MFSVPEQFSAATKANFDAQLALFSSLSGKAFEGVEKLIELNLNAVKSSLEESAAHTKQLLAAKDPQEFFTLSSAQTQPNAEKFLAYSRHLGAIASEAQAEITHAAEAQILENNRKIQSLFDEVSKNAPAGTEQIVSFFKTAMNNANSGYEQLSKTTKQAVEAIEANMNNTVNQLTQATAKATPRAAAKK
ncbi:phasin family protein [Undibacterium oligocarboniphilum]|uniref:Phasin family protein n=1 Tax=Undibacterium oligocarboniphilum TaxID=666702 RepID=A0A850QM61_9BURK|nr:phasin family protein [Undibacterium oligocarboniphilum]MBC3869226.1 phasin family protein [Undibacterium oligocarboniphilum]NVO77206.1 phasin family protein [Undibacterium oligocarboniphilum]